MKNNISEQVDFDFIQKRKKGIRIEDIAIEFGVGKSTVGRFHNGKSKAKTMKLSTFEKLYPKAIVYLFGEPKIRTNQTGDIVDSNANIGNNNTIEANNFLSKEEENIPQNTKNDDALILEYFNNPQNRLKKLQLLVEIEQENLKNQTQKTEGEK